MRSVNETYYSVPVWRRASLVCVWGGFCKERMHGRLWGDSCRTKSCFKECDERSYLKIWPAGSLSWCECWSRTDNSTSPLSAATVQRPSSLCHRLCSHHVHQCHVSVWKQMNQQRPKSDYKHPMSDLLRFYFHLNVQMCTTFKNLGS